MPIKHEVSLVYSPCRERDLLLTGSETMTSAANTVMLHSALFDINILPASQWEKLHLRKGSKCPSGATLRLSLAPWAILSDSSGDPAELTPRRHQLQKLPTLKKGGTICHQPK